MIAQLHYTPGSNVPCKAQGDIEGAKFVKIAAGIDGRNPVIAPATAGSNVFGVTAHDVKGDKVVTVYRVGHIVEVQATGSIAAGDPVAAGANGVAAKAGADAPVAGYAVTAAKDNKVVVALV